MKNIVKFAKSLSDENRLKIIRMLSERDLCVQELTDILGAPQARISQHLMRLRSEGIVDDRREGRNVVYSLNKKTLKLKIKKLKKFIFTDIRAEDILPDEFARLDAIAAAQKTGAAPRE